MCDRGSGQGSPPGPGCRGRNRRKPGLRTTGGVRHPSPPRPPQFLSWQSPVCDRKEAGGHGRLPRNQCCPVGPRYSRGPCPVCALHCGWLREVRQGPNPRASWVGGARETEGRKEEQEGSVYPVTEASAPWAGPAHLQKALPLGDCKSGGRGVGCHRLLSL